VSALTQTAGYPPHAVRTYRQEVTGHGVTITEWTAACGADGSLTGTDPFKPAGQARRLELCRACFPAGHGTYHPDPIGGVADPVRGEPQ
jgi:hypothetical protein